MSNKLLNLAEELECKNFNKKELKSLLEREGFILSKNDKENIEVDVYGYKLNLKHPFCDTKNIWKVMDSLIREKKDAIYN